MPDTWLGPVLADPIAPTQVVPLLLTSRLGQGPLVKCVMGVSKFQRLTVDEYLTTERTKTVPLGVCVALHAKG